MRILFLLLFLAGWLQVAAAQEKTPLPAPAPAAETFTYDISFLWFDRIAEGHLAFSPGVLPGTFQAVLEAKTLGVASWLTGNRTQRYVSLMERGKDGRWRPLRHESVIIKGKGERVKERSKRYLFEYDRGEIRYQRLRQGKTREEREVPFDREHPPDDPLTAFYNFREGTFGLPQPGRRYRIPTFHHDGVAEIVVETIADAERGKYPFFPRQGLLARVILAPEIFDTLDGSIYVWFDGQGRPARGVVENVIGLGNVRGALREN